MREVCDLLNEEDFRQLRWTRCLLCSYVFNGDWVDRGVHQVSGHEKFIVAMTACGLRQGPSVNARARGGDCYESFFGSERAGGRATKRKRTRENRASEAEGSD